LINFGACTDENFMCCFFFYNLRLADRFWAPPSYYFVGINSPFRGVCSRPDIHIISGLRMCGSIPIFPPHVGMACTGTTCHIWIGMKSRQPKDEWWRVMLGVEKGQSSKPLSEQRLSLACKVNVDFPSPQPSAVIVPQIGLRLFPVTCFPVCWSLPHYLCCVAKYMLIQNLWHMVFDCRGREFVVWCVFLRV